MNDVTLNQDFRTAMRQLAGGVSVITAAHGDERTGLTATSVVSISMDPAELLISVNQNSSSWPVIEKSGKFGSEHRNSGSGKNETGLALVKVTGLDPDIGFRKRAAVILLDIAGPVIEIKHLAIQYQLAADPV